MSARSVDAPAEPEPASVDHELVHHPLRHLLAGAAFTLAAANLALIVYLDLLTTDYDRYVWLINGPAPFDAFGSGPFQLFFHVAFALAVGGLALAGVALLLCRRLALVAGLAAGVVGVLAGPATLLGAVS